MALTVYSYEYLRRLIVSGNLDHIGTNVINTRVQSGDGSIYICINRRAYRVFMRAVTLGIYTSRYSRTPLQNREGSVQSEPTRETLRYISGFMLPILAAGKETPAEFHTNGRSGQGAKRKTARSAESTISEE